MKKVTVHIAFVESDFEYLRNLASEKELALSTFIRSYLLTTLRPRGKNIYVEPLKENQNGE